MSIQLLAALYLLDILGVEVHGETITSLPGTLPLLFSAAIRPSPSASLAAQTPLMSGCPW